jgi:dCTP deaminase
LIFLIYGDTVLKRLIKTENLVENLYSEDYINPASVNLRLGRSFAVPKSENRIISLGDQVDYIYYQDLLFYVIRPGEFILATTMEKVNIPKRSAAFVQGRSSIGRLSLSVQNAGYIDPGFSGEITLELKNEGPNCIKLITGYPICQLIVLDACDVSEGYHGKYVGQSGATGTRMWMDNFKENILKDD